MLQPYDQLIGKFPNLTAHDKQALSNFRFELTGTHKMYLPEWTPIVERAAKTINDLRRDGNRDEVAAIYYSPTKQKYAELWNQLKRDSPGVVELTMVDHYSDVVSVTMRRS